MLDWNSIIFAKQRISSLKLHHSIENALKNLHMLKRAAQFLAIV